MTKQIHEKQERVIEAVRHGFEGDIAVEFIRKSGYAMTIAGITRHLRSMGGKGKVQELILEGKTNLEILELCFPEEDLDELYAEPPSQCDLFLNDLPNVAPPFQLALYDTRKMVIKVPEDLYEAIRLAAKAENTTINQLIVDVLTSALSRIPFSGERTIE